MSSHETTMNNLCDSKDTWAMALHDGELAGEELRDVELHLTECAACRDHAGAQATAINGLRRKLAAPPAPDMLRARVMRALDAEDRAARRPLATWVLPGGAALAAVAALALFVTSTRAPHKAGKAVEDRVVAISERPRPQEVQGVGTTRWVEENYQPGVSLPTFESARIEKWGARLVDVEDREALQLFYRVTTEEGVKRDLEVITFDAHDLRMSGGRAVRVNDRVLRYGVIRGYSVVTYRDPRERAYVFTSSQASPVELVELVGTSSLLMQIRDDER